MKRDKLRKWFFEKRILFDASNNRWLYKDGKVQLESNLLEEIANLIASERKEARIDELNRFINRSDSLGEEKYYERRMSELQKGKVDDV